MINLKGKSFLKILDFSDEELRYLLELGHNLKAKKYAGCIDKPLAGKNIVCLFQKDSTRTRCAFEVAALDLGMGVTYIGPSGSQFGKKESVADSARVLGRMYDGIEFRGYAQSDVEALAKFSGVPVWNGLTDDWHPTQMIADFMTVQEHKGKDLRGLKFVYVGDGRNNVANSLMVTCAKLGMHFVCLAPKELHPASELVETCNKINKCNFGSTTITDNHAAGMKDADVVYTDVWVSMGETDWDGRLKLLHTYQVNSKLMSHAKRDAIFLHCLPAFHDMETQIGSEMGNKYSATYPNVKSGEFEVSNEVFESSNSKVFDQAENRLHSIKAIIFATLN